MRILKCLTSRNSLIPARSSSVRSAAGQWDAIRWTGHGCSAQINAAGLTTAGQRLTVAKDLGYIEVPCAVVDIDKTREKALNIALNKITGASFAKGQKLRM